MVGHSQGNFYANAMYDYLLAHGEPRAAVGVYQVASPASYVAGQGKYLTTSNDKIINAAREIVGQTINGLVPLAAANTAPHPKVPMLANITLPGEGYGHEFSSTYLSYAPERIVGDIQGALQDLKPDSASKTGECFTAPSDGLGYQATKVGYAAADTTASVIRVGFGAMQTVGVAVGNTFYAAVAGAFGLGGKVIADIGTTAGGIVNFSHAATDEVRPTNFDVLKKLYGSSLSKDDIKELLGNQGSAVATADIFAGESVHANESAPADDPSVQKITYLGHSSSGGHKVQETVSDIPNPVADPAPAQTPDAPAPEPDPTEPAATSTESAATTTEPEELSTPETPSVVPAVVIEDSFDSFNSKGWTTPESALNAYTTFDVDTAESGNCHQGACLVSSGGLGGLGTNAQQPYIVWQSGPGSGSGVVKVWAKRHDAWGHVFVTINLCAHLNECGAHYSFDVGAPDDNAWHHYLFAWRQGDSAVQICMQSDTLDLDACSWSDSFISAGTIINGIALSGFAPRSDLGDRFWLDDVSASW